MQAQRLLLKTNTQGKLEGLPDFAPNQDIEIIVLFNETPASESPQIYRKPPA